MAVEIEEKEYIGNGKVVKLQKGDDWLWVLVPFIGSYSYKLSELCVVLYGCVGGEKILRKVQGDRLYDEMLKLGFDVIIGLRYD